MKAKNRIRKRLVSIVLTLALLVSGIMSFPSEVYAAGWLDYVQETITLGDAVSDSIKDGDYYGLCERRADYEYSNCYYWHVYKFSMPQNGCLCIYVESADSIYFGNSTDSYDGFAIFDGKDPDNLLWWHHFTWDNNKLKPNYSSARGMYYGATEVLLDKGQYYFAVRQMYTNDVPYYLTISYKEPFINVSSISLNPTILSMEPDSKKTIVPTVLPNNATDKTIIWRLNNPSVATVKNGVVMAVSVGTATITAASVDGEITASCSVIVKCEHNYKTSLTPASRKTDGAITEMCGKCGTETETSIPRIENIKLSQTSYTYNGKICSPAVIVKDSSGKTLVIDKDYTVTYSGNRKDVGIYKAIVTFKSNYKGTETKPFTIYPKSTKLTSVKSKRKGFLASWKKQSTQISGYELAYSTNSKFKNNKDGLVIVSNNKTKKTVSRLEKGKKYYVRIRTYKNVKANGQTTKLYSSWSKSKKITTKQSHSPRLREQTGAM